jgi:ribosomal subunit interface protein
MRLQIKATGITLTPSIEEYVSKKIDMIDKHISSLDADALVSVEVGRTTLHHKSGDIFKAEIKVRANGREYFAVSEKPDLYEAIDDVKDEMTRELVSKKQKGITLLRRGGARVKMLIKRLGFRN